MTLAAILQLAGFGFAAGAVGALFGIGGGIVLVPVLSLVVGLPIREAVAASLVSVVAVSLASTIVHAGAGRVRFDDGVRLQFFSVVGAVGAGLAAGPIPAVVIEYLFATLLLVVAILMFRETGEKALVTAVESAGYRGASLAAVGSGVIAGLLGVGGGVINTPVLHFLVGRPFKIAIATSSYMIGVTGAAAAFVYLLRGEIDANLAVAVMLGTLTGAALAAHWGQKVSNRYLKGAFAALLVYEAAKMFLRGAAQ